MAYTLYHHLIRESSLSQNFHGGFQQFFHLQWKHQHSALQPVSYLIHWSHSSAFLLEYHQDDHTRNRLTIAIQVHCNEWKPITPCYKLKCQQSGESPKLKKNRNGRDIFKQWQKICDQNGHRHDLNNEIEKWIKAVDCESTSSNVDIPAAFIQV